ncbi:MAG TPA: hypothetical protein VHK05_00675 [Candidatus Limnocylindrales bacterium]|jgi:hypothetical protein|nr:hypothetical protein [Candidatus Limnocylindrales bacterium]
MRKATVTKLFVGSIVAAGAGAVLLIIAVGLALANDLFIMNGPDVIGVQGSPLALALFGLGVAGSVAIVGGMIGGLVSWIGALLNTAQLESKAWFLGLLLLGIFNFGFFAMIAYVLAGPDGTKSAPAPRGVAPVPA